MIDSKGKKVLALFGLSSYDSYVRLIMNPHFIQSKRNSLGQKVVLFHVGNYAYQLYNMATKKTVNLLPMDCDEAKNMLDRFTSDVR